jgi:predicted metal-dependent peptidase
MYFKNLNEDIFTVYKSKVLMSEETTEQDQMSSKVMDEKIFKEFDFRLTRCKTILYRDYPWFGILLAKLKTVPTNDISTMAVDDFGNIYMNPGFTLSMSEEETTGVLAHECMHIMTLSFFRQKTRDMNKWNIATDFVMNKDLVEMNMQLPKGGLIPEKRGDSFFAVMKDPVSNAVVLEVDITDMSAEGLYDEIEKAIDKDNKNKKKDPKSGDGDPKKKVYGVGDRVRSKIDGRDGTVKAVKGNQPGKQILDIEWDDIKTESLATGIPSTDVMPILSGEITLKPGGDCKEGEDFALDKNAKVKMDGNEEQEKKNSKKNQGDAKIKGNLSDILDQIAKKRESFDKHITQGDAAPTPLDTPTDDPDYKPDGGKNAESKIKDKVQSTLTAIASRGLGKGGPRSLTKKVFETKTNWKQLLRNFVVGMEKTRPTWMRPKKRAFAAGYYAPGVRNESTKIETVVALDTSGSISENVIALFVSELLNVIKAYPKVKMKVILWHSEVYGDIDIDSTKASSQQILQALQNLPYEGGGTTLSSVKYYLDKKYPVKKFNGFIVFTDGHIENNPDLPNIKNKLFLIVEKGSKSPLDKFGPVHEIDVYH